MGVRIAKKLGYGLTGVTEGDTRIDPLFWDEDGDALRKVMGYFKLYALSKTVEELRLEMVALGCPPIPAAGAAIGLLHDPWQPSFVHHIHPLNVLLFQPPDKKRWSRYNDDLDFYEERPRCENTIVDLSLRDDEASGRYGIHPHDRFLQRKDTLTELPPAFEDYMTSQGKEPILSCARSGYLYSQDYERLLNSTLPDEVRAFLEADWGIAIPGEILLFARHAEIFTNPATVFELKPLLCTYWS